MELLIENEYEIERGKPMPSKNHSIIQLNLGSELHSHYKKKYRFMSEIALDLNTWLSTPDIAIFSPMPLDSRQDEIRITEPPLGVIEIVSPSQSFQELTDKASLYFQHGVKSVWLVVPPTQFILVYQDSDNYEIFKYKKDKKLKDKVLEIEITLSEIFE